MTKYVKTQVKKIETPISIWAGVLIFGILAIVYVYFIANTVRQAMAVEDLTARAEALSSRIVDREADYTRTLAVIDESYARLRGFEEASSADTHFIEVNPGVALLTNLDR